MRYLCGGLEAKIMVNYLNLKVSAVALTGLDLFFNGLTSVENQEGLLLLLLIYTFNHQSGRFTDKNLVNS